MNTSSLDCKYFSDMKCIKIILHFTHDHRQFGSIFCLSVKKTRAISKYSILLPLPLFPCLESQDGLTALDVASGSRKGNSALVCEVLSKHMQDLTTVTLHDPVSVTHITIISLYTYP